VYRNNLFDNLQVEIQWKMLYAHLHSAAMKDKLKFLSEQISVKIATEGM